MTAFDGFGPKVKRWFQDLQADNSREYFAAHRDVFEEAIRDQMEALLTELGQQGLYASISARGLVAGSGYHVMARDQLDRYRDAVVDDARGPQLGKLVAKAQKTGLEVWGESLVTAPRGYPKDHPRIELLRRKSLALGTTLPFGRGIGRNDGLQFVTKTWRAAAPVTCWLEREVGPTTLEVDRARG